MEEEEEEEEFDAQEEFDEQLFVEQGEPLRFHLHRSIRLPGARNALRVKIETYGGTVVGTDIGSNVILVDPNHSSGDLEIEGVYVEPMRWVQNCVSNGKCVHNYFQKRMGGKTKTERSAVRVPFTVEDDRHLIHYIATLIPDKEDGGRNGNTIYKRLMQNADIIPEEYGWVLRHTWHSWRERYKQNQAWFDPRIAKLAKKLDPAPHQKYELSRKVPKGSRRKGGGHEMDSDDGEEFEDDYDDEQEEEEEEDELEQLDTGGPSQKHRLSGRGSQRSAKRPRISRSPSPQAHVVHEMKGKEKAPPPDDDDGNGYYSDRSLFGDYEPGPSGTQHTSPPPPVRLPTQDIRSSQPPSSQPANIQQSPRRQQPARGARPLVPRAALAKRKVNTAPEIIEVEAPYRSTRARTRSLEPYVADVDALARQKRQQAKKKVLEPVEEQQEGERDTQSQARSTVETQEEMQNVEDFLMAANDHSGISDVGNAVDEEVDEAELMPPPRETRPPVARQPYLDTDDEQTDAALRSRQVSFSPVARSSVLRSFGSPRLSRLPESVTSKAASTVRQSSVRVPSIDLHSALYSGTSPSRKGSDSSAESFPMRGTRAKTLKREIKAHEKHTPYRPLQGTRAAKHVREQT
ncbi:hypothetical protein B0H11DRAFT_1958001 [Mycena galericulata]|nr:hypothetical protein B0H11DRAFT_1958001 [Mycena galericulata]